MQQNSSHIIARQTIELKLPRRENGFEWNQKISEFCNIKLKKALNQLFDNYSNMDSVIRLDKLEVDLGQLNQTTLDDELVSQIITRLDEQLFKIIKLGNTTIDDRVVQVTTEKIQESVFNDWLHYLKYGFLPVQAARVKTDELNQEVLSIIAEDIRAREKIITILQQSEIAANRLILQHSDIFLQKLLTAYVAIKQDRLTALFAEFKQFEKNLEKRLEKSGKEAGISLKITLGIVPVSKRLRFWKEILDFYILEGISTTNNAIQNWQQLIVNLVKKTIHNLSVSHEEYIKQTLKNSHLQQELTDDLISYPLINPLSETHKKVVTQYLLKEIFNMSDTSKISEKDGSNDSKISGNNKRFDKKLKQQKDSEYLQSNKQADNSDFPSKGKKLSEIKTNKIVEGKVDSEKNRSEEKLNFKTYRTDKERFSIDDDVNQDADSFVQKELVKQQKFQKPVSAGESFYIQNAGVVLLNPFLVNFLKKLELLNENDFVDDYSRQKAVHLIHYLATGQTGLPDYDLLLPKLLCGVSFEEPIDRFIEIRKEDKEEADNLLSAAVEHWGALKKSSPDALREGFLQRDGKLEKVSNGWRLYVEQNTIDFLLSKLPFGWGLGTIKLPWMEEILYVEWG